MEKLEDALRKLIEDEYGSVNAFAKKIDVPTNSVYNALNRGMANTRTELTDKIYRSLNIDWDSAKSDDFHGLRIKGDSDRSGWVEVPLYGSIAAGKPIEMQAIDDTFVIPSAMRDKYPDAFLLKVVGESMNKVLPNGSYALINPASEVADGKAAAVCVNGYDATIKRVKTLSNGIELCPDSTDPTIRSMVFDYADPDAETVTVIGEVVWCVFPFDFSF